MMRDPRIQVRPPNERVLLGSATATTTAIKPVQDNAEDKVTDLAFPDSAREQQLLQTAGVVQDYYRAGQYRPALQHAQELFQQTTEHFGRHHLATAAAYSNVALMHKQLGQFVDSCQHYTAALQICKTVVGPDHASYGTDLQNLGQLQQVQIHVDTDLTAIDRLTLMQQAVDNFAQSNAIL